MAEPLWQVFAESAREYDAWFDEHRLVYESELQALKRFIVPGGLGLEIGVGTGRFAAPLGIEVGVEPARAMAALARRRGIKVVRGAGETLPFSAACFDLAVIVTALCFIRDPFGALTEATRVLKPGGQILVGEIDKNSPLGQSYEAHKEESKFYRQARFYAVEQVWGWLKKLGYEGVQTCQTIFKPLREIVSLEPVRDGHGQGGFVVISARKTI
jgi:ubiquinone/menaquinone biosynthesis C-methylase UbiE